MAWLALSYRIVRRKVQSLVQLEDETRNIGDVDQVSQFHIDSNDEIGNLSRAFTAAQAERDRYFNQSLNFLAISRIRRLLQAAEHGLGQGSWLSSGRTAVSTVHRLHLLRFPRRYCGRTG